METRSEADDDELPREADDDERPAPRHQEQKTKQPVGGKRATIAFSHAPPRFSARSHLSRQSFARTSPYFLGCTPEVRSRRHLPRPTSAPRQPGSSSSMSQWTPGPPSTYPHSSAPPALGGRSRREVASKEAAGGGRGEKTREHQKNTNQQGVRGDTVAKPPNKKWQQHAELRQSSPERQDRRARKIAHSETQLLRSSGRCAQDG